VPEAVETLHCPTCLSGLPAGGNTPCPVCRTPLSRGSRPLPLLERELQARIEAKTAPRYRQRRRAAKVARRIAALPATLFEAQGVAEADHERPVVVPGPSVIVDLPDTAVLAVRSTSVLVDAREPAIEVESPAPNARRLRRPVGFESCVPPERIVPTAPIVEPARVEQSVRVEEWVRVERPVRAEEPVRVTKPHKAARPPRVEKRPPVEKPGKVAESPRVDEAVRVETPRTVARPPRVEKRPRVERPREVAEPPRVEEPPRVQEDETARIEKPRKVAEPRRVGKQPPVEKPRKVAEPRRVEKQPPVEKPRKVAQPPRAEGPPPAEAAPTAEPEAKLASVTRIGSQVTNPVWKDRVFNSARRRPETVTWPRPRPFESPAEPAVDRFGRARG